MILTGDQDAFQIIDSNARISLLVPSFGGGLNTYDRQKVYEKWGVYPEQVPDFKGLKGDTSDNIPGVPGIGDKTAAKLLQQYQTLENILDHAEEVSGKKLRESLMTYREQALLSKDLATIRYDAPVTFSESSCHLSIPDVDDFLKFLAELEFRSFINQSQTLLKPFLAHLTEAATDHKITLNGGQKQLTLVSTESGKVVGESAATVATFPQDSELKSLLAIYQPPFQIMTQRDVLERFLAKVRQTGVLTLDIETSGLDFLTCTFAGVAMSWTPGLVVSQRPAANPLGLKDFFELLPVLAVDEKQLEHIETVYVPLDHPDMPEMLSIPEVMDLLKPVLEDPAVVKIAHNAKYERNVFRHHDIRFQGLVFDTMLASYVINPDRRHGLKALAHDVLGHQMREITELIGTGKKQILFTQVCLNDAAPYAACDAHVTAELAGRFIQEMSEEQQTLLYEVALPLVDVLSELEYNGVSLDTNYLSALSQNLGEKLAVVESEIYAMAGVTFNLNSPKQVG